MGRRRGDGKKGGRWGGRREGDGKNGERQERGRREARQGQPHNRGRGRSPLVGNSRQRAGTRAAAPKITKKGPIRSQEVHLGPAFESGQAWRLLQFKREGVP